VTEGTKGLLAMVGACSIWGLSPIYYKLLAHIPAFEVLANRMLWSFLFFAAILLMRGRGREIVAALSTVKGVALIVVASLSIATNWFLFIYATLIDRNTETSLGYYIFPLVAVLVGRFVYKERMVGAQMLAVGLAALAVAVLAIELGALPWMSLLLAATFVLYGIVKKNIALGPMVSVTCEVLVLMPVVLGVLVHVYATRTGAFGSNWHDSLLLLFSGPLTLAPMILFSYAAKRISMSALGVMQYINPTLQFLCAVVVFSEPFTAPLAAAFGLIWAALAIFSASAFRQDRAARRVSMAASGVATSVSSAASEGSAKP